MAGAVNGVRYRGRAKYDCPARRTLVRLRTKSRTTTRPLRTTVRVPSQRSIVPQMVPRTVAEAFRPRVLNRPLALPRRLRTVFVRAAYADADAPRTTPQERKLPPVSRSSVRPLALF